MNRDTTNLTFATPEEKQEFYKIVHDKVRYEVNEYYDKNEDSLTHLMDTIKDEFRPLAQELKNRMQEIETTLAAQATGLQNVYDEFKKLTKRRNG